MRDVEREESESGKYRSISQDHTELPMHRPTSLAVDLLLLRDDQSSGSAHNYAIPGTWGRC